MSEFACPVARISSVGNHPNADRLDVIRLDNMDFDLISGRGNYQVGDKVVYIPEQSILPDDVLDLLGMKDHQSLKRYEGVRRIVRPVRLRGVFSEGLMLRVPNAFIDGVDLSTQLGITKYVPSAPAHLSGRVKPKGSLYGNVPLWDLEPLQKSLDSFQEGEMVVVTEKLHGTQINCGMYRDENGRLQSYVSSKGLIKQGFELDQENNPDNLYVKTFKEILPCMLVEMISSEGRISAISLCGEIVGPGIQDLKYGLDKPTLFVYAVRVKYREGDRWTTANEPTLSDFCERHDLRTVPILYKGPFNLDSIRQMAEQKETVSGKQLHTTEGVVVSRLDGTLYKKYVGQNYKLRGGNTSEHE